MSLGHSNYIKYTNIAKSHEVLNLKCRLVQDIFRKKTCKPFPSLKQSKKYQVFIRHGNLVFGLTLKINKFKLNMLIGLYLKFSYARYISGFDINGCPLARGHHSIGSGHQVSCIGCPTWPPTFFTNKCNKIHVLIHILNSIELTQSYDDAMFLRVAILFYCAPTLRMFQC